MTLVDENMIRPDELDPRYVGSPFQHLKVMHAKQKGKRFEMITSDVCQKLGHKVEKPTNTDHDRIIDGIKSEIKGSTLAKGTDHFSFLQIRPDQDYERMIFSMFYPNELVLMEMDKQTIRKCIDDGVFKKQHGGNKANSGTYCYYGNKETLSKLGATIIG